jgi:hypothetical protein
MEIAHGGYKPHTQALLSPLLYFSSHFVDFTCNFHKITIPFRNLPFSDAIEQGRFSPYSRAGRLLHQQQVSLCAPAHKKSLDSYCPDTQ